ncbi:TPA: hypothetical protein EYP44_02520 [Candidatus Bathyarchaeota archaeon]|nr:hypothetical protein [Candidatus Bathyarchaeota archaeon]
MPIAKDILTYSFRFLFISERIEAFNVPIDALLSRLSRRLSYNFYNSTYYIKLRDGRVKYKSLLLRSVFSFVLFGGGEVALPEASNSNLDRGAAEKLIPSGIGGLDGLLGGGLIRGFAVLVIGPPGSGKTFVCHQFVREGLRRGEPCVFMSTLLDPDGVRAEASRAFGSDYASYERRGLLRIVDLHSLWAARHFPRAPMPLYGLRAPPLDAKRVAAVYSRARAQVGEGGRDVLHSASSLFATAAERVRDVLELIHALRARCRRAGNTLMYAVDTGVQDSRCEGYARVLADYVVETEVVGEGLRLRVRKAPVGHDRGWHPFAVTREGVVLVSSKS